nr:hypothetical protein [Tanacetum cinerariifolium]
MDDAKTLKLLRTSASNLASKIKNIEKPLMAKRGVLSQPCSPHNMDDEATNLHEWNTFVKNYSTVHESDGVKMHKVLIIAYSKDRFSLIGTQIGKPIMLDAFTSFMCVESWGRIGYARALIEVCASKELKEEVIMVVPIIDDNGDTTGYTKERIRVEYEWKPPFCLECHVFGHSPKMCLKRVTQPVTKTNDANNDGFMADDLLQDGEVGETSRVNNTAKVAEPDPYMSSDSEVEEMVIEPNPRVTKLKGASTPSHLMFSIATWNIRGLNRAPKQYEVCQVVNKNQLSMRAILESHVDIATLSSICSKVFRSWDMTSNGRLCYKGCHIILSHLGSSQINLAMIEFKDCVSNIEVMDINNTGLHFTWNQKPKVGDGVLNKLNRIMGNIEFIDSFPGTHAIFQPYMISSHSLANRNVEGHTMFQVVNKMKSLKKPLRKLVHDHGNLHDRASKLRAELDEVQKALDLDPNNQILREGEAVNMECEDLNIDGLFQNKVSGTSYLDMVRRVSDEEIKNAMFDIGDNRGPGPDAFTSAFFKKGWDIVGPDVCKAIRDFFTNDRKILTNRIIRGIKEVVTENQSAFVPSRRKRGLRQGDPLSPYLFTLVMEVLMLILKRKISLSESFRYHKHCEELQLINVCFADDLFIFARGDVKYARLIMESLDAFKFMSGLVRVFQRNYVKDLVSNDGWNCSQSWLLKALDLGLVLVRNIDANKLNAPRWRNRDGSFSKLLVRNVWEAIMPRGAKKSLKTQDKPRHWDVRLDVDLNRIQYPFYDLEPDSHDHLFFECSFSSQNYVKDLVSNDGWNWSQSWLFKALDLGLVL